MLLQKLDHRCRLIFYILPELYRLLPCENHECLSIISGRRELSSVGLQNSQTKLEDGFDSLKEEAVDHAHSTLEGQDTEEEGEKPREGDRGEGGEVWHMFSQLWQALPDQLLKHRLVHLSSCRRKWSQTEVTEH